MHVLQVFVLMLIYFCWCLFWGCFLQMSFGQHSTVAGTACFNLPVTILVTFSLLMLLLVSSFSMWCVCFWQKDLALPMPIPAISKQDCYSVGHQNFFPCLWERERDGLVLHRLDHLIWWQVFREKKVLMAAYSPSTRSSEKHVMRNV
jgi:hypothetical protein